MRTTLDIDDEVLAAAKEFAQRRGTSAARVVSDLLRKALTNPEDNQAGVDEPKAHYGFRPFPNRGSIVTDDLIETLREQEDIY